jgi:hypothetical protein
MVPPTPESLSYILTSAPGHPGGIHAHRVREGPQLHARALQMFESDLKRLLVKGFGALHVLNIEFEPTYNIAVCIHCVSLVWYFEIN